MKKWFKKNKRAFAIVIAVLIALIMGLGPLLMIFAGG
jgi:hypothetical protein